MRSLAAETLRCLRRCREENRPTPPHLIDDAIECLRRVTDADVVRAERDALIREAASLLPPAPPYRRAGLLKAEAAAMERVWHTLQSHMPQTPYISARDALHAARLMSELPDSVRQYYRLLCAGEH